MMKSILVVAMHRQGFARALDAAWMVAERFGSYVECMPVQMGAEVSGPFVGMHGVVAALGSTGKEGLGRSKALEKIFRAFSQERRLALERPASDCCSVIANWPYEDLQQVETVGERGRVFDLVVVGWSEEESDGFDRRVVESALFHSGRPVLIAPSDDPNSIGNKVLIVWNNASSGARAVGLAMPILQRAAKVLVLNVEDSSVSGSNARDLQTYLTRNGISTSAKSLEPGDVEAGQIVLDEADAFSADLIVKGAFVHGRLRQRLFGGVTEHLLTRSHIPLLMVH